MEEQKIPYVPEDLVNHLKTLFPDQTPSLLDSEREVWAKVGCQQVIRYLDSLIEDQNQNII